MAMYNDRSNSAIIRHSGRAHIRGKIRRVWRPRFLELCDNGLVKYYEIHDENQQQVEEQQADEDDEDYIQPEQQFPKQHYPKCTLQIYHARIIDVTTFRDLHVGLPKGTYGFVFHGRREIDPLVLACHPPEHVAPRDFFCAVATLEEAQSWVVALQWAASVHNSMSPEIFWSQGDSDDDFASVATEVHGASGQNKKQQQHRKLTSSSVSRGRNAFQVITTLPPDGIAITSSNSTSTSRKSPKKTPKPQQGKIVVTKVRKYRFVRLRTNKFQAAYEIQLLLLRTRRRSLIVEERSVARTKKDLQKLLQDLSKELKSRDSTNEVLKTVETSLSLLQDTSYEAVVKSVSIVDGILRILAMDATICNSQSMRTFWSISDQAAESHVSSKTNWIQLHESNRILTRKSLAVPKQKSVDDFVKQWLSQEMYAKQNMVGRFQWYFLWTLRHPSFSTACLGILLLGVPFLMGQYEKYMTQHLPLRLDVLIVSWIATSLLGREWGRRVMKATLANIEEEQQRQDDEVSLLEDSISLVDYDQSTTDEDLSLDDSFEDGDDEAELALSATDSGEGARKELSSPLPQYPGNGAESCWSKPKPSIFRVRGESYLIDRVKIPSGSQPFECLGVDIWLTDNPERHIARHPSVLGGKLGQVDTFMVNFLLPFGNFVAYFSIPPLEQFPPNLAPVWSRFLKGDQQYRDARLKLLPIVVDGPWIVKKAVGPGTSPALLGKVIPLQYYFSGPDGDKKGIYEVDVIITASRIAKGVLSVVKGHSSTLTIAFAFIIEAADQEELPETALCTFQMHSIHLEDCPQLPECNLDEMNM